MAQHQQLTHNTGMKVYFCDPYSPWQRGSNENTNGLLRQYFPQNMSLRKVTQMQVDEAVYALNHRPRKCLNDRTPHEVFHGLEMTAITLDDGALRT